MDERAEPYRELSRLLASEGQTAKALDVAEQGKGRVLVDVLRGGRTTIAKGLLAALEAEESQRAKALSKANVKLASARTTKNVAALADAVEKARRAHEEIESRIFVEYPQMRVDRGAMTPATLRHLGALIADDSTAMLEYVTTEEGSTLFILTRNAGRLALFATPLRASRDDIERQLASFLDSLRSRDLGFADASRRLSSILLKKAEPHLRGKTRLIIVPDGPLWSVPFEALETADGRFLIERASVSFAPSLTAYAEMVRALRRKEKRPRPTLLAFANPVGAMAPLPDAETEARQIAALYPRSAVRLGRDASVAAFKREASQNDVIHLATHAVADDADPMYSYLVFARDTGDDGRLEAWQVAELDVRARMVVLSACETGAGRYSGGEGMIGLSWAWLIAGAPTTVVSRWNIDSAATSALMTRFHERLAASPGVSVAEALRWAAVSMLNDSHFRHPFYWASFQVVGAG